MCFREGWSAGTRAPHAHDLAFDALEQALCHRDTGRPLLYYSDHGAQRIRHARMISWFNTERLLEPSGYLLPAENEAHFHHTNLSFADLILK